jgi:hypothetical protein
VAPERETEVNIGGNRPARLVDISPGGAHVELSTALNPNQTCRLWLSLPEGEVKIKGRVAHCKLTGFESFGSGGRLVYRAGLEFLDLGPSLERLIKAAFPIEPVKRRRTGPIKVKVDVSRFEEAEPGEHGAN